MSYSYREGKDEVHFVTEEDLEMYNKHVEAEDAAAELKTSSEKESGPSAADGDEGYAGAVSETGEINWDCPCLGGLATEGPCIEEFKAAFSCWLYSTSDKEGGSKGDECHDKFMGMTICMSENEEFYDDLNARNKAAAEAARVEYEREEQERLDAAQASMEQLQDSEDRPAIEDSGEQAAIESSGEQLTVEASAEQAAIEDSEATPSSDESSEETAGSSVEAVVEKTAGSSVEEVVDEEVVVVERRSAPLEPYQYETLENTSRSTVLVAARSEDESQEAAEEES